MTNRLYDSDVYSGEGIPENNINPDKRGAIYIDYNTGNRYVCRDNRINNNVWIKINQDIPENISNRLEDLENTSDTAWIIDKPIVHFHAYGVGIGQLYKNKYKYPVYLSNIVINGNYPTNYNLRFTASPNKEFFSPIIPAGERLGYFGFNGGYKSITSYVSAVPNTIRGTNYATVNASNLKTNFSSGNSMKRFRIPPGWYFTLNLENIISWDTRIAGFTQKPSVKYVRDFVINTLNGSVDPADGLLRENQNNMSEFLSYCVESTYDSNGFRPASIKDLFKAAITTWNGQIKNWPE